MRFLFLLAIAASVILVAAVTGGAEPAPTVTVVPSPSVRVDGFDWADAAIGAVAACGLGLLLAGTSALLRRRQRVSSRGQSRGGIGKELQ